ncbi:taurine catabolism dioxygenase [Xylariaceae sp. FL0255]|nr:taurine catabolism dioxygenase [Xylariaceae sp. FL0255]
MPDTVLADHFKTLKVRELHPTFAAEVTGVNFQDVPEAQFKEITEAMAKYGVCVFRNTDLNDAEHVAFSERFGDLDNIRRYLMGGRKPRYDLYELFDAGNIAEDGGVLDPNSPRAHYNRGNSLWHVDSSFNPRRASFSLLRACALPPAGHGGNTDFADSRTAFDELPEDLKRELLAHDYVGAHSIAHSRKLASPEFFKDMDPLKTPPMHRHKIVQLHEPSGRTNLYIGSHMHHIEEGGVEVPHSWELVQKLNKHATREKYRTSIEWHNTGDMIIWDNRCVLHRAGDGTFEGKFKRDLRRTTVHDDSPTAWGVNDPGSVWQGFDSDGARTNPIKA